MPFGYIHQVVSKLANLQKKVFNKSCHQLTNHFFTMIPLLLPCLLLLLPWLQTVLANEYNILMPLNSANVTNNNTTRTATTLSDLQIASLVLGSVGALGILILVLVIIIFLVVACVLSNKRQKEMQENYGTQLRA